MDPISYILGGLLTGVIVMEVKQFTEKKKLVSDDICKERRDGCNSTNTICFDHIKADLEEIKSTVKEIAKNDRNKTS